MRRVWHMLQTGAANPLAGGPGSDAGTAPSPGRKRPCRCPVGRRPWAGPFLRWVKLLLHHRGARLASGTSSGFCPHYSSLLGTSVERPKCATNIAAVGNTTNLQIHTEQTGVLHLIQHRRHTCFSCKHYTAFLFFLLAF